LEIILLSVALTASASAISTSVFSRLSIFKRPPPLSLRQDAPAAPLHRDSVAPSALALARRSVTAGVALSGECAPAAAHEQASTESASTQLPCFRRTMAAESSGSRAVCRDRRPVNPLTDIVVDIWALPTPPPKL